ncbi:MAG: DUF378 domain-containing protein [Alphaproteobacteria bacterium]|nr:DUF378 domain-containing protein [Alphaproteobacteria bacterium]
MALKRIALFITVLGSINWGLIGAFGFDLVKFLFGFAPGVVPVVQIVVGLVACYTLFAYMIK